jgi:ASC-1-like (ASCH) protein
MDDLKLINARLQELNKEFRDLSALKKQVQDRDRIQTIKQKYGDFKFMIKSPNIVEEIDFDKLSKEADLQVGKNNFGLPVIAYNYGNGTSYFSIVKNKEEVYVRLAVDKLLSVADGVKAEFETDQTKIVNPVDIFNKFEEALEVKVGGVTTINSDTENLPE